MSEQYNEPDLTPVDSAGCEYGEVDRPAHTYYGRDSVELKIPSAPNGWIRTKDPVSLGCWE